MQDLLSHLALTVAVQNMPTSTPSSAPESIRDSSDNRTLVEAEGDNLQDSQPQTLSREKGDPWLVEFDHEDPYNPKVRIQFLTSHLSSNASCTTDLESLETLVSYLIGRCPRSERVRLQLLVHQPLSLSFAFVGHLLAPRHLNLSR